MNDISEATDDPEVIGGQEQDTEHVPESESEGRVIPMARPGRRRRRNPGDRPPMEQIMEQQPGVGQETIRRMNALATIRRSGDGDTDARPRANLKEVESGLGNCSNNSSKTRYVPKRSPR
jgi:hypothetical protein